MITAESLMDKNKRKECTNVKSYQFVCKYNAVNYNNCYKNVF